ncbi:MAG: S1 RNA-binding domain-containing protein [Anaerolineae bacterium]
MSQEVVVEKETPIVVEADTGREATDAGVVETASIEIEEASNVEGAEATDELEAWEEPGAAPAVEIDDAVSESAAALPAEVATSAEEEAVTEDSTPVEATTEGPAVVEPKAEKEPAAEAVVAEQEPATEEKAPEPKTALNELQAGAEIAGRVVGIADFGAFVDIGAATDGLIHISELSDGRVKKVSDVVSVGQQVSVWIKDVDVDQERISLSMRPKPKYRLRDLKPGMVVEGTVTGVRDYGVFVDIGSETEGLVHVSEMAEGYVSKPSEMVSSGDDVEVRIKKIDRRRRRISLSMKGFSAPAHQQAQEPEEESPTSMELAMRRALGVLEEQVEETVTERIDVEEASRDELGDVFARMLRDYSVDTENE